MTESTSVLNPRIMTGLSCPPSEDGLLVTIAGCPYWADSAPALQGGVDEESLRAAFTLHGETILHHLDGAFAAVIQSGADTYAVTDRFNVIPLYVGKAGNRIALSTETDALARRLGIEDDLDLVTMAQALQMWYATHPYTFYRSIRELEPASIHHWDASGRYTRTPYWEAQFRDNEANSTDALADELAAAIRSGVRRRIEESERPGLFLSAGADSRGILFPASEVRPVTSFTFYDLPNAELVGARRLAEAAGQRHIGLQRDPEHYGRSAVDVVRLSGGMWNFLDGHAFGFTDQLKEHSLDLLLTGDFADLLFKGNGFDIEYRTFAGKALPLKKVAPFRRAWRRPRSRIADAWETAINERLDQQYREIETDETSDESWWRIAHARVGSLTRAPAYGGIAAMQRSLPWDTFMADARMAAVYEKLTISARINAGVWEEAVRTLTPRRARRIANNNVLAPVGATDTEKVGRFLYGVAYRRIVGKEVDGTPLDGSVTRGSWPNWSTYLSQSPVIANLWSGISADSREIISLLRGEDPWQRSHIDHVRKDALGFGRLLTQALWLDERKRDG